MNRTYVLNGSPCMRKLKKIFLVGHCLYMFLLYLFVLYYYNRKKIEKDFYNLFTTLAEPYSNKSLYLN